METKLWPDSTSIARTSYNAVNQILEVETKKGKIYRYKGFPSTAWEETKNAESIGRHMHAKIINQYEY